MYFWCFCVEIMVTFNQPLPHKTRANAVVSYVHGPFTVNDAQTTVDLRHAGRFYCRPFHLWLTIHNAGDPPALELVSCICSQRGRGGLIFLITSD